MLVIVFFRDKLVVCKWCNLRIIDVGMLGLGILIIGLLFGVIKRKSEIMLMLIMNYMIL